MIFAELLLVPVSRHSLSGYERPDLGHLTSSGYFAIPLGYGRRYENASYVFLLVPTKIVAPKLLTIRTREDVVISENESVLGGGRDSARVLWLHGIRRKVLEARKWL